MDYIEELAKAKKALSDKPAEEQRKRVEAREAFQFLDRLRHFLLNNGSPGREEIVIEGDPRDLANPEYGWAGGSPPCM